MSGDEGSRRMMSSAEVRDFYERMPYPPPLTTLEEHRELYKNPIRRSAQFHLLWPTEPLRENLEILVAGCGTSQAARYALREPNARVTGIDLSETSLRFTKDLKQKYDLKNLELHQLPIERVGELGRTFDQIVCTGVLHHLPDPEIGLRALRDALRLDGAMHLMVYAAYGQPASMIKNYCGAQVTSSEEDLESRRNTEDIARRSSTSHGDAWSIRLQQLRRSRGCSTSSHRSRPQRSRVVCPSRALWADIWSLG